MSRACIFAVLVCAAHAGWAGEPQSLLPAIAQHKVQEIALASGELTTRLDGPKLWTLSGLEHASTSLATQDSAYGTVVTMRGVGHLGTAHLLDVPGMPGQVEKELVHHLAITADGIAQTITSAKPSFRGKQIRVERRSSIRTLNLNTTIHIQPEMIVEIAQLESTGKMDLQSGYPWMYALMPKAEKYLIGKNAKTVERGNCVKDGKTNARVVRDVNWLAVYDPSSKRGVVVCGLAFGTESQPRLLFVDAPGNYRKVTCYAWEDQILDETYRGTYASATGHFSAEPDAWEDAAKTTAARLFEDGKKLLPK